MEVAGNEITAAQSAGVSGLLVGGHVVYVDQFGRSQDALVTAVWGNPQVDVPCINVVIVSADTTKTDSCGRQIERETSVVHKTRQPAHGRYYMMLGDTPNPVAPVQK